MIDILIIFSLYVGNGVAVLDPKRQLSCKAHLTMAAEAVPPSEPAIPFHPHFIQEHKKRKLLHGACNSKALLAACRSFIKIAAATSQ